MRLRTMGSGLAAFTALFAATYAAEFKRLDGIHRIEKREAHITAAPADGLKRREEDVCGANMSLCPSSLDGGCCPDGYSCAKESCHATTRGPSTCGGVVGWYGCDAVYGGGCCPDGYICETRDDCLPPAGSSYTYDCPASYALCPASASYGCCPEGMGCGVNQCFSTKSSTITTIETRTTTDRDGEEEVYTTRVTSVVAPETPTALPDVDVDPAFLKYFPSSTSKIWPSDLPEDNNGGGGGGGLSTAQLAGIVTGAVAFLILVLVAAFIIIRHLNKVVARVEGSKASSGGSGPVMVPRSSHEGPDDDGHHHRPRGYSKPTDSEVDTFSIDPSITTPRLGEKGQPHVGVAATDLSGTTPSSFAGHYQAVSTANTHGMPGYFDVVTAQRQVDIADEHGDGKNGTTTTVAATGGHPGRSSRATNRISGDSEGMYAQSHNRNHSNISDESGPTANSGMTAAAHTPGRLMTELANTSIVPELYGSPADEAPLSALEEARRRSTGSSVYGWSHHGLGGSSMHQRARNGSGGAGVGAPRGEFPGLGIVDEEIHGFYGPRDHTAGVRDGEAGDDRPKSRDSWIQGDDGQRRK